MLKTLSGDRLAVKVGVPIKTTGADMIDLRTIQEDSVCIDPRATVFLMAGCASQTHFRPVL